MRHRKAGRQFGRNTSHRRAMFRALAANLIAHERIETTDAKAKELRRVAERLVTRAKRLGKIAHTPHDKLKPAERAKRMAAQKQMGRFLRRFHVIQDGEDTKKIDLIEKVFIDLAKRFADRPGGYTRILKLGPRRGDNAPMSIIEFVDYGGGAEKAPKKKNKPAAKKEANVAAPAATASTTDSPAPEKKEAAAEKKAEKKEAADEKAEKKEAAAEKKAEKKEAADEKAAEKKPAKKATKKATKKDD